MASWKKYFSAVPSQSRLNQRLSVESQRSEGVNASSGAKYSSYLPEVYSGAPNRIERYVSYEQMDLDSEISKGLDVLADYSVQNYDIRDQPFQVVYNDNMTETEIGLLKDMLRQWCKLNRWHQRLWRTFRSTLKYGDQIFVRDPETFKLIWIDPAKVEKIIVNEDKGKSAQQYVIKDLDLNLTTLVGTNMLIHDQYSFPGGYPRSSNPAAGAGTINYGTPSSPGSRTSRFNIQPNELAVDAAHVVHLSLSEGMDSQWPFGTSILESIYKVYKQKDLLEDCILIYRVVRAPERRVFYIDTGSLSGPRAQQVIERMKNEIYQRRIPNRTGGGQCLDLDTVIPLLDGRSVTLSELISEFNNGKTNWVYSVDVKTGGIVPGLISWAGITRKNTQVIKLTLDNGETLIVTPDHKIPILGKGNIQAKDIEINRDSLISFNTRTRSITDNNSHADPQYHQIFDHGTKDWIFTHRMAANYFKSIGLQNELIYDRPVVDGISVNTMLPSLGYSWLADFKNKALNYNHKVVAIEWLDDNRDTGTITVDGKEIYHDFHNFATNSGVFVCNSILDAAYSPIAINEDFFLAQNSEGKGTRIETLPGGENLGQIDDLKYFNNKMIRGLGIPSSYLPTGPEDGTTAYTDGKVGTAYVQEFRFAKVCQRLQNLMTPILDKEFKMFVKSRGIEISSDEFDLKMWEPQSFSQYRQMALDSEQIGVFSSLIQTDAAKYISKRFALKRYLNWTDEDILENERQWKEENAKKVTDKIGVKIGADTKPGLNSVGIRPNSDTAEEPEPSADGENAPDESTTA